MGKQKIQIGSTVKSAVVSSLSMIDEAMYGGTLTLRNITTVLEESLFDSMTDKLTARTQYELKLQQSLDNLIASGAKNATTDTLTGRI